MVRALVDLLALRLLRRHVFERADDRTRRGLRAAVLHRPRDAEVHDQRVAARGVLALLDHDVLGLQVAVHDALVVRGRQAQRHLARNREGARHRQLALAPQASAASVSPSMNGIVRYFTPAIFANVVNADDVLVGDLAGEHELALEAQLEIARGGGIRLRPGANHLDGHRDAELVIERLVDGAHAAGAEQPDDRVARADLVARP